MYSPAKVKEQAFLEEQKENLSEKIIEASIQPFLDKFTSENPVRFSKPVLLEDNFIGLIAVGFDAVIAWRVNIQEFTDRIKEVPHLLKASKITKKTRALKGIPNDDILLRGITLYGKVYFEGIEKSVMLVCESISKQSQI